MEKGGKTRRILDLPHLAAVAVGDVDGLHHREHDGKEMVATHHAEYRDC
jgi:hypothetical protein